MSQQVLTTRTYWDKCEVVPSVKFACCVNPSGQWRHKVTRSRIQTTIHPHIHTSGHLTVNHQSASPGKTPIHNGGSWHRPNRPRAPSSGIDDAAILK